LPQKEKNMLLQLKDEAQDVVMDITTVLRMLIRPCKRDGGMLL